MSDAKKLILKVGIVVLCFALIAAAFIFLESKGVFENTPDVTSEKGALDVLREKEVVYFNGESYLPNHSVYSYLFVGLDQRGTRISNNSYVNELNADFLALLVVNGYTKEYTVIMINRDTMVTMDTYGLGNKKGSQKYQQITMAHTYGDGLTLSAENVTSAVSNLLYGVDIANYLTVTIDAVEKLTDLVGGVNVYLDNSYPEFGQNYKKGNTILLTSENVEPFIRSRSDMQESTNAARMERQKMYLSALFSKLNADNISDEKLSAIFTDLSPYMITNFGISSLTNIVNVLTEYKNCGIISPIGVSDVVDGHVQFKVDEQSLKQMVADLFYKKTKN